MKVAIIEPVGGHGGMDYYDFGLCAGLAHAGVDVVLHTCDETEVPVEASFNVRHSFVSIYGEVSTLLRGLRYLRGVITALYSAVREGRKICHFHLFHVGLLQVFTVALAKLMRRKVVITAHDVESFVDSLESPVLSRWVYRRADRIVAHNLISRQELIDRIGIDSACIAVIPHGNYLHMLRSLPTSNEARRDLGINEGVRLILFFGQIKGAKGLDLLLEAMPSVLEKHPDAMLLIAGKPWKCDFSDFESIMEHHGIRERCITHIRHIPDDELPCYYAAADLVVLPYRRIYQSGVVLMAMSYERPVLVSDLPGMTEIVVDGDTGLVFNQGNVASLAVKINEALSSTPALRQMAIRGYQKVLTDYDWNVIGEKTNILYAQTR